MTSAHTHKTLVGRVAIVALLAALSLSGCSDTRRALGYDRVPPDEFTVVSRAPLSQPPDFALRPPEPGAPRPQEGSVRDQAARVLLNSTGNKATPVQFTGRSPGEQVLLTKAGAERAQPDIRRVVNEETTKLIEADKSFSDKILFWQTKPKPGEPLDAKKEAERLQQNASLGKPPTDGDSPQITRRKKGWLEDIF